MIIIIVPSPSLASLVSVSQCCLIAFLNLTETKLRGWTVKYGREEHVQSLLEQYANFVSRNRIFQEFNKAFVDMQQVVEEYKREGGVGECPPGPVCGCTIDVVRVLLDVDVLNNLLHLRRQT